MRGHITASAVTPWLTRPIRRQDVLSHDRGIFDGSFTRDGVPLVSRPQLYVDLKRRSGAAAESAAFLRERGELWPR